ncbi:MAG: DUF2341 domain-containing protein, partial [Candidatus Thorarchaeota archaeon]
MKVPVSIVIILLFLSPVVLGTDVGVILVNVSDGGLSPSSMQGWLSGWEYRKSHTVEGSLGAGTDYQVQVVVHYGSGDDAGEVIYCANQCKPGFGDIRFTDDDGTTLLDYWNEYVVMSDHAVFWIEISDNLNISQSIYVYYGNSEANSVSDGSATFMYFDDFENNNFDAWDAVGSTVSIQSSVVRDGSYSAELPGGGTERHLTQNISQIYNGSFMVHTWANLDYSDNRAGYPVYWYGLTTDEEVHGGYSIIGHYTDWSHTSNSVNPVSWPANSTISSDLWYRIEVGFDFQYSRQYAWNNRSFMGDVPLKPQLVNANVTTILYLYLAGGYDPGRTMWIDNYYVRKWIPSEPTHGGWGDLEYEPTEITSPSNMTYEGGTTNNFVTWSIISGTPMFYEVYLDSNLIENETWVGAETSISVDGLSLGTHNLTIKVFDMHSNSVTDTMYVTVEDTTNPIINHPPDVIYNETSTGNMIQWNP